jgi:hypothetical protein
VKVSEITIGKPSPKSEAFILGIAKYRKINSFVIARQSTT